MNSDKSTQLKAAEGSVINLLRINLWMFFPFLITTRQAGKGWCHATEKVAGDSGRTTARVRACN